jgi:hypothetical protein
MAQTRGKVAFLKVSLGASEGSDGAFFQVKPESGSGPGDFFWVWWTQADTYFPTAADWITRNMVVAMLRDALAQKLTVVVSHAELSGECTQLTVEAAP